MPCIINEILLVSHQCILEAHMLRFGMDWTDILRELKNSENIILLVKLNVNRYRNLVRLSRLGYILRNYSFNVGQVGHGQAMGSKLDVDLDFY